VDAKDEMKQGGGPKAKALVGITLGAIALTLVLYLLAFYFLPPPAPSAAVVSLFAFVAICLIYGIRWMKMKKQP